LSARLATVPVAARLPLLAIAATSQPTWDLVLEIAGSDDRVLDALGQAEATGIIERADGRVRFSHPLLGSTLYLNASAAERRRLHARLATSTGDPEERARHLALAAAGPDPVVASALEDAARHARARGAPDAAAELAELAGEMTAEADRASLRRRRLAVAEYRFDGGDATGAQQVLRSTIAASDPGRERAQMLYRLASMSWMNLTEGVKRPCETALGEAGDDPTLRSAINVALSWVAYYQADLPEAIERARESAAGPSSRVHAMARADALGTLAFMAYVRGEADDALSAEAIQLQDVAMAEASWTEMSVYTPPRTMLGLQLMWSFRLDDARAAFEHELAEYERHAMYVLREEALCYLSELESRAGNGVRAAKLGAEAMSILEETGQTRTQVHVVLFDESWAAALLGQVEVARRKATDGARIAEANDDLFTAASNRYVLGFLALSLADYEDARLHLEHATRFLDHLGSAEPGLIPSVPDLAEAYVGSGRIADAERVLDRLEAQAGAPRGGRWAEATAARGRAMLAAATGDLDAAIDAAERSIGLLDDLGLPFDVARSRLVLGQIHRRAKQKRLAREQLELARGEFARLGAVLWEERARVELTRIGGRRSSPYELTDTEFQIAALVAEGRTNQETADALFVSESTVKSSLKRIYQKLEVRSRTELAAKLRQSRPS
jgi:DNA-binding CsgD family transcriptional regulator